MAVLRPPTDLGIDPQKRFRLESGVLLALACVFIILSHQQTWFAAWDRVLYDVVITRAPASYDDSIVIVGIDDASLHRYGPWPWPRHLQARLLAETGRYGPANIAVDIIYAGETGADRELIDAAASIDTLALPLMVESLGQGRQHVEVLPFSDLLDHADTLGHVHIELDDDAIARGTHLYQGVGQPHWPHLMLALAGEDTAATTADCDRSKTESLFIAKCGYIRIPFAGPPGTYAQISAERLIAPKDTEVSLLERAIRDKTVLIGLTASGVGDWVTSPASGERGPMSGVEFNANLLAALRHAETISPAPAWLLIMIGMLLTGCCSLLLPRLKPTQMVAATMVLALAPVLLTTGALMGSWYHLPLANATIAVLGLYPLWSWRRHEIAWQFIQSELNRIDAEQRDWQATTTSMSEQPDRYDVINQLSALMDTELSLAPDDMGAVRISAERTLTDAEQALLNAAQDQLFQPRQSRPGLPGEVLAAQINRLEQQAKQVREGRAMGLSGLRRMSSGVIILGAFGELHFMNHAGSQLLGAPAPGGRAVNELLAPIQPPLGQSWNDIMREVVLHKQSVSFEGHTPDQTPIFVSAEPLETDTEAAFAPFWVVTLSNLSAIRAAEAQREEALAFLSHDIRSPLLSVLALIRGSDQRSDLLEDIERYTQKGLSTSEQFLQLSRLQLQSDFERYELELEQVLHNAVEQVYFLSKEKNINVELSPVDPSSQTADQGIWLEGNGELLERALVNLLGNAIKYSDPGTRIHIDISTTPAEAVVNIADQGHGIPAAELPHIFEPYFRSGEPRLAENRGAGLGLRFVKTVMDRHGGHISVQSTVGKGTRFTLRLPTLP